LFPSPLSEKRSIKSASRQEGPSVPFTKTGRCPRGLRPTFEGATFENKLKRGSAWKGRGERINFQKKVEHQENQSSRKLLQQHREQEIGRKKAPNSFEEPTFLGEHNCRDDNLREERGRQCYALVMPIPCRSRNTEDHIARQ